MKKKFIGLIVIIVAIVTISPSLFGVQRSYTINYIDKNTLDTKISMLNNYRDIDLEHLHNYAESIVSGTNEQYSSYSDSNYFIYPGTIVSNDTCPEYDMITNVLKHKIGIYYGGEDNKPIVLYIKEFVLNDNSNNGDSFLGLINKKAYNENATIGILYAEDLEQFMLWKNEICNDETDGDFYYIEPISDSMYSFCFLHYKRVNN